MEINLICAECGLSFNNKKCLVRHLKSVHSGSGKDNVDRGLYCEECNVSYSSKGNLVRHLQTVHRKPCELLDLSCWVCGVAYSCKANVLRHVKRKHPDSSIPEKKFNHCCSKCTRRFSHLYNLKFHMRKAHNLGLEEPTKHKCPLCCEFIPGSTKLMQNHFKVKHDVNILKSELEFNSFKKFNNWKERIETETNARFVRFARKSDVRDEFRCHRSGVFVSKSRGLRKLKSKGSRKIDGVCPANITLYKKNNNLFRVVFVETHVGHENDLQHLWLTEKDRLSIACRIANKVPFDIILEDMKKSHSDSNLERKHLITKKDLYNIQATYGLGSKRCDEEISIDSWVVEAASTDNSCILFYKTMGSKSHCYNLNVKDFVLILMNDLQCEVLLSCASDMICLNRTHCLNKHGFELISMCVMHESIAFPCIFIVTNRTDKSDCVFFFNIIKQQVGCLKSKLVATDSDEALYEAWSQVMGAPEHHVISPWHVDWSFRRNLVKIKKKDKQITIYKSLSNLLEERDFSSFKTKLNLIIKHLEIDPDMQDFSLHFKKHFFTSKYWTRWHAVNCGLENFTQMELLHKTIKYIYLNKSNVRHVDKAINSLMKYIRDRFSHVFFKFEDIEIKIKEMSKRHNDAVSQLSCARILEHEKTWKIDFPGIPDCEIFTVNEVLSDCSCSLLCEPCGVCLHRYSCTCIDSCLKWNMCEHIHLICTYLKANKDLNSDGIIYYDIINVQNQKEVNESCHLNDIVSIPTDVNIVTSHVYTSDVNTLISNRTDITALSHTLNSDTSYQNDCIHELTNGVSNSNNHSIINNSSALLNSSPSGIPSPVMSDGDDTSSNMDSLIETLQQRKAVLSQKILDLLHFVENIESVEMVDAIEKLVAPMESTITAFKTLTI